MHVPVGYRQQNAGLINDKININKYLCDFTSHNNDKVSGRVFGAQRRKPGPSQPFGSEVFKDSNASASAKSLVRPDALLLHMKSSIDGVCT
jgi:hypothetical protein